MKTLNISARVLGHSFARDPELRVPQHPRFIREVLTIPYGTDGLLFEGVRDVQVITGRSARSFLPRLLPLLDGTRSIDALAAAFPTLPPQAIHDAVALLYSRGLLEDGPLPPAPERGAEKAAALAGYAGRYVDVTRVNRSRGEVLDRLAAQNVAVIATSAATDVMAALADQGLGALSLVSDPGQLAGGGHDLVIGVFAGDADNPRDWFSAAWNAGIRALHVHVGADKVELGPYFIPGTSGCYDCFRALVPEAPGGTAPDAAFWSGVAALQAFNLLSRIGPVKLYNVCRVHRRTSEGPMYEKRNLARLPGCPACGLEGAGPPANHPDTQAWILHNAAHVMTAKELRSPRDHQIHYAASNLELTEKPPAPRHGAVTIPLPTPDHALTPIWSAPARPRDRIDLDLLADLLRHAAGYQAVPGGRRRIAPSGGGLASADLFVIVRKLPGLEAGTYHYFGWEHRLERIGIVQDEALAGALGILPNELPPVAIIGTSDLRKTRQKYDEFSFRIGTLDGGVARQYLQDIADAAGVTTVEYPDTRDPLLSFLLQLPQAGNRRMHCFAIGLGKVHVAGERPDGLLHHYQSTDALIAMCGRLGPTLPKQGPALPPPRVAPHEVQSLGALMQRRRSHRLFAERPMSAAVLHSLAALGQDAALRRDSSSGLVLPMTLWFLVQRAQDLAPGIYRWDHAAEGLQMQRPGLGHADLIGIMQQHGYAEAPLTCIVTGDFGDALQRYGPRGYREISSRAGSMLARIQLAGLSWDVVGSMWGGVAEESAGRLLGIDRYRQCPLFAASFGYASDG